METGSVLENTCRCCGAPVALGRYEASQRRAACCAVGPLGIYIARHARSIMIGTIVGAQMCIAAILAGRPPSMIAWALEILRYTNTMLSSSGELGLGGASVAARASTSRLELARFTLLAAQGIRLILIHPGCTFHARLKLAACSMARRACNAYTR